MVSVRAHGKPQHVNDRLMGSQGTENRKSRHKHQYCTKNLKKMDNSFFAEHRKLIKMGRFDKMYETSKRRWQL